MGKSKLQKRKSSNINSNEKKKISVSKKTDYLLSAILGIFLVLLAIASISYANSPTLLDHFEAHVACVSHRVWLGYPIYHDWNAPDRYSTIMGPNTYLWNALWQGPSPETIYDAKVPGILACWLAIVILGVVIWRKHSIYKAIIACGVLPLIGLMFHNFMYWNRSDPFLLLVLVVGAVGVLISNIIAGAALFGAAVGLAFGAKFHSVIFFIPLLAFFNKRILDWKPLTIGACTVAGAVVIPFLFPQVSLGNYLKMLGTVQEGPILSYNLGWISLILMLICLPAIGHSFAARERRWIRLLCWFVPVILLFILTAKYGLERHHIMPLSVPLALIIVEWIQHKRTVITWVILALLIVVVGGIAIAKWYHNQSVINFELRFRNIQKEVESILQSTEGLNRAMGYSGLKGYGLSQWRVLLVFQGENTLYLDGPALMDHRKAGIPFPSSTINAIKRKDVDLWLIPKGGDPWSLRHVYRNDWEIFPEEFNTVFQENYRRVDKTRYYTLWLAKGKQHPGKFVE